jgi:hypothetical protein
MKSKVITTSYFVLMMLFANAAGANIFFYNQTNASVDTTFIADHPAYSSSANFNGTGELIVDASTNAHTLIRFDDFLGNGGGRVALGTSISEAYVRLRTKDAVNAGSIADHKIREITTTWDVGTVTFDSFGSIPGVQFGTDVSNTIEAVFVPDAIDHFFQVDITSLVQGWINGATNNGIMISQDSGDGAAFYADKNFVLGYEPTLMVAYDLPASVPTPPNLILFAISLAFLSTRLRKSKT